MNAPLSIRVDAEACPSPHSFRNKVGRVVWGLAWTLLFRPTPRILFAWRRQLLRLFGAQIGRNARISSTVRIWAPWNLTVGDEASIAHAVDCYCVATLRIGNQATVSQEAFLCGATHSVTDPHMGLVPGTITIEDQTWVCARAFISPGVTVQTGAVVGACAVVTKDVPAWTIVVGNPARYLKHRVLSPVTGENPIS
jgi:putative colanic acid biosynthesis acetyltransferase WcaF